MAITEIFNSHDVVTHGKLNHASCNILKEYKKCGNHRLKCLYMCHAKIHVVARMQGWTPIQWIFPIVTKSPGYNSKLGTPQNKKQNKYKKIIVIDIV
jgi:hypothetical protein